ncbi:hypothetical protein FOH10_07435 [Nocardia otitidiscaviarum]|uniref:Uncharacterized protein n=1 Tax=Nocardia otitidiscaviarum TaxID=1823 RepID=A0A516NI59_9NOCA|nr:hypothetical protein [Nocardia otitidiscaviarum]MCP9619919.1 hypothetical protein [Nocardia otitidiscaviarum]QDP78598.1 hypothetical protein FOH10_07435 [Nocardia otitidiscaviarum]
MPSTTEFAQLTPAGIEQIKQTGHARFDLRNRELTKAAAGMEGQIMGPIIGGPDQPMITLELLGPNRTETIEANTIGFVSSGPAEEPYQEIVFFRPLDTPEQANGELREGITRWGFNAENVRLWEENTSGKSDYQQVVSMGLGPSGLVVEVEAYLQQGRPLLRYIVHLEPYLYTPQALEEIRTTGNTMYTG